MDPATLTTSEELRKDTIDSVARLINLWLDLSEGEFRGAVASRLQRLISGLPWLLGSLHPLAQDFLLNILHLHPPAASGFLPSPAENVLPGSPEKLRPGPLNVVLPGLSEPSPRRKRQQRCKHVTPQPDLGTSEQTAVVSERDTCSVFAFSEPTLCVKNCSHSGSSKPGVKITRTVNLKTENVKDFC